MSLSCGDSNAYGKCCRFVRDNPLVVGWVVLCVTVTMLFTVFGWEI